MTIKCCQVECKTSGFKFAGVEYDKGQISSGQQKEFANGIITSPSGCEKPLAMQCEGDNTQVCGTGNRVNVYSYGPIPSTSGTPSLPALSIATSFPGLPSLSTAPDTPSLPTVPDFTRTPSLSSVSGTPSLPGTPDSPTVPRTSRLSDLPIAPSAPDVPEVSSTPK
ncbi:uncharacterized protein K444DRAFT_638360 [Hyaloscypha bicolor E]|uniref:Uncharacterized protein n=1 Tax=Hyaloscypha bicolor E TaxID=1095630 RepID=A0A2J6SG59_9HELO|nr:uncharacterized protein K444DRAFT_638360 [Hyaloscypha bicolor E]PMD49746.1 hypothetical protein K444DRAFT_638360 [Hyaloscypha bicolor E]